MLSSSATVLPPVAMQESPSCRQPNRKAVTVPFSINALILKENTRQASGKSAFARIEMFLPCLPALQ